MHVSVTIKLIIKETALIVFSSTISILNFMACAQRTVEFSMKMSRDWKLFGSFETELSLKRSSKSGYSFPMHSKFAIRFEIINP